ncbi:flagellar hook-basal body complex protein FliE [Clostridium gasigenes]|uniref:flagellar hook-basal body complex protein FliE n=1 Tax=Clostridium gasigenes TaxID=94869 RepID=UPI0014383172|nr:flagellar hook-basal body complex protein FliE [Clostridium gasigenes]MBU3132144.1 flagellar hook-basal body complex protein FliE [Clostridium gasigenes]NKF06940.1 flagellar hook-basal body complex protein FliE [Clostridium gasigenes]QSW19798.1 flagellar hook-basal body complex protein FliE [Clostridium gasigenes]
MKINGFVPSEAIFNNPLKNDKQSSGVSFDSFFKESLDKVNDKQVAADELTKGFVSGKDVDINDVMLAGEEAKISLQLAVQIRNKVVEAVQELTRMQL